MAPAAIYPGTTINDRSSVLQDRDLLSLFLSTATHDIGHARAIEDNLDKIYRAESGSGFGKNLTSAHVVTTIGYNTGSVWMIQNQSPLTVLLSDLRDLLKEENEDEKPTYYAFTTALSLVMEASMFIYTGLPFAAISTDNEGGIRIEWIKERGEIRLVIPASSSNPPYIYYEFGDKYGVDKNASAFKLIRWINRLNSYGTSATTVYVSTVTLQCDSLPGYIEQAFYR